MKIPACILITLLAFLLVQPLFSTGNSVKETKTCKKVSSSCGETGESSQDEKDCGTNRCNPFMSCTTGNFYVIENIFTGNHPPGAERKQLFIADDNRLLFHHSECWHPPEFV